MELVMRRGICSATTPQRREDSHPNPAPSNKRVAFTSPLSYASRLAPFILLNSWAPLHVPTVLVEPTPRTRAALHPYLLPPHPLLNDFSAVAFTSRNAISAFSEIFLAETPPPPLSSSGDPFLISALGKDADLLDSIFLSSLCPNPSRIRVLIPPVATPAGMVRFLGPGSGRRILCPVPLVVALEEPPVIPDFLNDLTLNGWVPVRVSAYETRWAGPTCATELVGLEGALDAIVFTSTAEIEGLLKSLKELGLEWRHVREKWPDLVVAAHGPVTAAGAARLGVGIDVISRRFESFEGVVAALYERWRDSEK